MSTLDSKPPVKMPISLLLLEEQLESLIAINMPEDDLITGLENFLSKLISHLIDGSKVEITIAP